jgi:hypothetical protein
VKLRILQCALCLIMAPLLVAQEISPKAVPTTPATALPPTIFAYPMTSKFALFPNRLSGFASIPSDIPLELTAVNPLEFANAVQGTAIEFQVVRDVSVKGIVVLRAGTRIEGTVSKVHKGKRRIRKGVPAPLVQEVALGKSLRLELRSMPTNRFHFERIAKDVALWTLRSVAFAAISPLVVISLLGLMAIVIFDCKGGC